MTDLDPAKPEPLPYYEHDTDPLPLDDPPWARGKPRCRGRGFRKGIAAELGPASKRADKLLDRCSKPSGVIYLVQLANDVLKVGSSVNPDVRMEDHRRRTKQPVVRRWVSPVHLFNGVNEQAMIRALGMIGRVHEGREWFTGVEFDTAVNLAESLIFPDLIRIEEPPASPAENMPERPPLAQCSWRLTIFDWGMPGEGLEWDDLAVFERVGFMARRGLDTEAIARREGLPAEVVPGLLWYFENMPDIRSNQHGSDLARLHWTRLLNDYCGKWEAIVEQRHKEIRQSVTSHVAVFLGRVASQTGVLRAS